MKNIFRNLLNLIVVISLFLTLIGCCTCDKTNCKKPDWGKVKKKAEIIVSIYNNLASTIYPSLNNDQYRKVAVIHNKILNYWNLSVKALTICCNNKSIKEQNDIIKLNLAGVQAALNELSVILPVDDKWKTAIQITITISINVIPVLLTDVEFTDKDECNLSGLEIKPLPLHHNMPALILPLSGSRNIMMPETSKKEIINILKQIPEDERTREIKDFIQ